MDQPLSICSPGRDEYPGEGGYADLAVRLLKCAEHTSVEEGCRCERPEETASLLSPRVTNGPGPAFDVDGTMSSTSTPC